MKNTVLEKESFFQIFKSNLKNTRFFNQIKHAKGYVTNGLERNIHSSHFPVLDNYFKILCLNDQKQRRPFSYQYGRKYCLKKKNDINKNHRFNHSTEKRIDLANNFLHLNNKSQDLENHNLIKNEILEKFVNFDHFNKFINKENEVENETVPYETPRFMCENNFKSINFHGQNLNDKSKKELNLIDDTLSKIPKAKVEESTFFPAIDVIAQRIKNNIFDDGLSYKKENILNKDCQKNSEIENKNLNSFPPKGENIFLVERKLGINPINENVIVKNINQRKFIRRLRA